jgi:O-methyltransferase
MKVSRIKYLLTDSRWNWFIRGLPPSRRARALLRVRNNTMTTFKRCCSLWDLSQRLIRQNIPGAFVECGVWLGGSAGLMGLAIESTSQNRQIHLFDSFQGLPEPGPSDGAAAKEYSGGRGDGRLAPISRCDATLEQVQTFLFERLRLNSGRIQFHVGWFQQTIPAIANQLGPVAMLRLDGDWYESTQVCLQHLYPKLSPGGVVILDDYYCWEGCRKATDEYREAHGIAAPIVQVDLDCGYWIKPK